MSILAWRGTKSKEKTLAEFRAHIAADELISGAYGETGENGRWRGCAVGCLTGGENHYLYPAMFGIPVQLAYLHDVTFEGLSRHDAQEGQEWSYRFLEVIPEGADLSRAFSSIMVRMLTDREYGVLQYYPDNEHKPALLAVAALHQRVVDGGEVTVQEWGDAADATFAACASDVAFVARAAARADAYAAAFAAAYVVADAAWVVADAAFAAADVVAAAASVYWQWFAGQILDVLEYSDFARFD